MLLSKRMKEKDNVKCKEWERRRREKINDAFKNLSQLLPNYDPAKSVAKIDILEKSTEFVKELRLSNSRLLSQQAESDEKCKLIKELQDEVNKLILRVKQLTTLLKQAKIAIPIGPHIKSLGKKKLKWSEKIGPEDVENSASNKSCNKDLTGNEGKDSTGLTVGALPDESRSSTNQNPTNNVPQLPLKEPNLEVQPAEGIATSVATNVTTTTTSSSPPDTNSIRDVPSALPPTPSKPPGLQAKVGKDVAGSTLTNNKKNSTVPQTQTMTLPMQTIILTSCPMTPLVNQSPQMITRIALGPTRILPKPADGVLRKIAILPIRKPLPPKEKKRRNRKKKVPVVTAEAQVQTKSSSDDVEVLSGASEVSSAAKVEDKRPSITPEVTVSSKEQNLSKENSTTEAVGSGIVKETTKSNDLPAVKGSDHEATAKSQNVENELVHEVLEDGHQPMEVDMPEVAEEVEISSSAEVIESRMSGESDPMETPEDVLMEGEVVTRVAEGDQSSIKSPDSVSATKTLLDISSSTTLTQGQAAMSSSNLPEAKSNDNLNAATSKEKHGVERSGLASKSYELKVVDASDVERNIIQPPELDRLNTPNPDTNSSISDAVSGDKISECIARSIDLIDAPDGELMELADNWGDSTANSPKSPISPTQMFLNMFPLLPRESIVSVSEGSQQGSGAGKSNFQYRSSFYIDAMLPDDPPPVQPPSSSNVIARDTTELLVPGSKDNRQNIAGTVASMNPATSAIHSISTTSADPTSSTLTMTSSSISLAVTSSVSHRPVSGAVSSLPQFSQKSSTLPTTSTSSGKQSSQKQNVLEITKSPLKSKISQPESKDLNKNALTSVLPTSSTSFLSDFNLFPEPLDFGNFHHLSLSQMSLTEDLFREVSRIRNPAECQQANPSSISNPSNVSSNFQQFDFGNQFHYPHQPHQQPPSQKHSHSSADPQNQYSISDMTNSSVADSSSRSHSKQTNSHTESQGTSQFYQPMNFTATNVPDYSNQTLNSNLHSPRYDFNSESGYNARQSNYQPYAQETIPQPSQKPNSSSSNSNKHQLFRPQDFNQPSMSGHHQQNTHSTLRPTVTQNQPSVHKSMASISTVQGKQGGSVGGNSHNHPAQVSSTVSLRQDTSKKNQITSNSQALANNQLNNQSIIHQSYVAATHPAQVQIGTQSKEPSKQQQYQATSIGTVSNVKQSRSNANASQAVSKADQQQTKSYSKSQSSKNSESSSSRKSSAAACHSSRRTNQGSSSGTVTTQQSVPQHAPQNIPRLPDATNQFPLVNNAALPIPSFPDFSLAAATNFHQQYETFPPSSHYHHHQPHPPNNSSTSSSQPNPVHHQQQRKSTSASVRHTPFYLQDVNPPCETYNYPNTNPPQTINLNPVHSSTHHHIGVHGPPYNTNASASQPKPPNYPPNNQSTTSHHSQNHPNYFGNPASHNAPMYPSGYIHQNSPTTSSARTHQQDPLISNYNLNSSTRNIQQSSNSSSQQSAKINKPSSSAAPQMQQSNPTNYPSNSGDSTLPNSSMPSSRPVNWMTTDTSSRTNNKPATSSQSHSRNAQQSSSVAPANPFSVSKLVGNASVQSSNNSNTASNAPANKSVSSSMVSSSARCSNSNNQSNNPTSNSSYCAESLIRKNPSNNNSNNSSWNNLNFGQIQQPNQHHSVPHQLNISNVPYEIPHNDQFNFTGYHTTNFPQHTSHQYNASHNNASESGGSNSNNNNNSSSNSSSNNNNPSSGHGNPYGPPFASHDQQQQHSQQPHHVHQSQYHHHFPPAHNSNSSNHHLQQHHGTTSSVSNFNLSSIFPEINDKRGVSGGVGGNSSSSNVTGSNAGNAASQNNSNNSCNYYATVHSRK